jgi:hypothetical protein
VLVVPSGDKDHLVHPFFIHILNPHPAGLLYGIPGPEGIRKSPGLFPLVPLELVHFLKLFPLLLPMLRHISRSGPPKGLSLYRKMDVGINYLKLF